MSHQPNPTPQLKRRRWRRLSLLTLLSVLGLLLPHLLGSLAERMVRQHFEARSGSALVLEGFRLRWSGVKVDRVSGKLGGVDFEIEELRLAPPGLHFAPRRLECRNGRARALRLHWDTATTSPSGKVVEPSSGLLRGLRAAFAIDDIRLEFANHRQDLGSGRVDLRLAVDHLECVVEASGARVEAAIDAGGSRLRAGILDPEPLQRRFPGWSFPRSLSVESVARGTQLWPPVRLRIAGPELFGPGLELRDLDLVLEGRPDPKGGQVPGVRATATVNGGTFGLQGGWPLEGDPWVVEVGARDLEVRGSWQPHLARLIPLLAGVGGRIDARLSIDATLTLPTLFDPRVYPNAKGEGRVRLSEGKLAGGPVVDAAARLVGIQGGLAFRPFETPFTLDDGVVSLKETVLIKASVLRIKLSGQTERDGSLQHRLSLGVVTPGLLRRWLPRLDEKGWLELELRGTLKRPRLRLPEGEATSRLDGALRKLLQLGG